MLNPSYFYKLQFIIKHVKSRSLFNWKSAIYEYNMILKWLNRGKSQLFNESQLFKGTI